MTEPILSLKLLVLKKGKMNQQISKNYTIETDRFILRIPNSEDFPHVFSATRFEGFNDGMLWDPPENLSDLNEPLKNGIKAWESGKAYSFTILKKGDSKLIGRIGIRRTDTPEIWSVGFWTHPEVQNQGVMTEALQAILLFGFKRLEAKRIEACHAIWNKASEKVLLKNGMRFVRFIEKGYLKKGQWVAENLLAIDRIDFVETNKK